MSFQTNPVFEMVDVLDKSYYTYPIQKSTTKTRSLKMKFIRNKIKSIGKRILGIFIELWFIVLKPNIDSIIDKIIPLILDTLYGIYDTIFLPIIIMIDSMFRKINKVKFVKRVSTGFKTMGIVILNRFKYFKRRKRKRVKEHKHIEPEVVSAISTLTVIAITMIVMSTLDMDNHQHIKDVNNSMNTVYNEEELVYQMKKYGVDGQSPITTSPPIVTSTTTVVTVEEETIVIEETITETEPVQTEPVIEETPIVYSEPEVINDITIDDKSSMTLLGNLRLTGYVATGNKTANGEIPYVGGVAMSRSYGLPYGTRIYIDGLGYFTLNDTGCKTGVVDIFCNTVAECYALTSYANVYIVN